MAAVTIGLRTSQGVMRLHVTAEVPFRASDFAGGRADTVVAMFKQDEIIAAIVAALKDEAPQSCRSARRFLEQEKTQ